MPNPSHEPSTNGSPGASHDSSESKETPPPSRAQSEWGEDRWSRRFSWGAFVGVVITFALAIFGDFPALGAWGFHLAVVGAAIVAMLLVALTVLVRSRPAAAPRRVDRRIAAQSRWAPLARQR